MVAAKASLVSLVQGVDKSPVVVGVGVTRTQSLAPGVEIYTCPYHCSTSLSTVKGPQKSKVSSSVVPQKGQITNN